VDLPCAHLLSIGCAQARPEIHLSQLIWGLVLYPSEHSFINKAMLMRHNFFKITKLEVWLRLCQYLA